MSKHLRCILWSIFAWWNLHVTHLSIQKWKFLTVGCISFPGVLLIAVLPILRSFTGARMLIVWIRCSTLSTKAPPQTSQFHSWIKMVNKTGNGPTGKLSSVLGSSQYQISENTIIFAFLKRNQVVCLLKLGLRTNQSEWSTSGKRNHWMITRDHLLYTRLGSARKDCSICIKLCAQLFVLSFKTRHVLPLAPKNNKLHANLNCLDYLDSLLRTTKTYIRLHSYAV